MLRFFLGKIWSNPGRARWCQYNYMRHPKQRKAKLDNSGLPATVTSGYVPSDCTENSFPGFEGICAARAAKFATLSGQDLRIAQRWFFKLVRIHVVRPSMWSDSWTAPSFARNANIQGFERPSSVPRTGPVPCVRQSWCIEKRQCPDSMLQAEQL